MAGKEREEELCIKLRSPSLSVCTILPVHRWPVEVEWAGLLVPDVQHDDLVAQSHLGRVQHVVAVVFHSRLPADSRVHDQGVQQTPLFAPAPTVEGLPAIRALSLEKVEHYLIIDITSLLFKTSQFTLFCT